MVAPGGRFGRFEIVRQLGEGASGVVFEAKDPVLSRHVALKVVKGGDLATRMQVERMRLEGQALARVRHPHVVGIHEAGSHQGQNWIAMELLEGKLLAAFLNEGVPLARRLELVEQVARGVAAAHEAGVLHRDLKPSNVIVEDATGLARVVDFGLAKLDGAQRLTVQGAVMGSPAYAAPELIRGEIDQVGPATDVYSLGVILVEAITARVPASAFDATGRLSGTSVIPAGLPASLHEVCRRAVASNPEERFPTATAFADAVRDLRAAVSPPIDQGALTASARRRRPGAVPSTPPLADGPTPSGRRRVAEPPPLDAVSASGRRRVAEPPPLDAVSASGRRRPSEPPAPIPPTIPPIPATVAGSAVRRRTPDSSAPTEPVPPAPPPTETRPRATIEADPPPSAELSLPAAAPAPARLEPYEFLEELGRGATASVFRARHKELDRFVAIKVLEPPHPELREEWKRRVQREAKVAARLEHPGIVRLYEARFEGDRAYMVMELVRGQTLAQVLEKEGPLPGDRALLVVEKLARALHHAHELAIVHRDLKPANVVIDKTGEPRILDLGIAKDYGDPEAYVTESGRFIGTPTYAAPEQIAGDVHDLDARADVWALGAMLYELIAGHEPFRAEALAKLVQRIVHLPPDPLPEAKDAVTARAGQLALWAMEKDRSKRPPTALAFAQACFAARVPDEEAAGGPAKVGPAPASEKSKAAGSKPGASSGKPLSRPVLALAAILLVLGVALITRFLVERLRGS